jgi:hypothetical protein
MSRNENVDDDDEDGWEYYYEEEEEEVKKEVEVDTSIAKPAAATSIDPKPGPSRPSSRQTRSRPSSRTGSRPNSRLRTKTPLLGDVLEDDENGDWEWEYYYEEEEEELNRLSPTTTTAPTTRATSPFPPGDYFLPLKSRKKLNNIQFYFLAQQPSHFGKLST